MRVPPWFGLLAALLLLGTTGAAADVITLRADRMVLSQDGHTLHAEGSVRAETQTLSIVGDRLTYDRVRETLRVEGSVVARDNGREFRTEYIDLDLGTRNAEAGKGSFLRSPDYLKIDADSFRATPSRADLTGCVITTCGGDIPAWSIATGSAWTPPSGLLRAQGATFRVRDVPVLYAPYLAYPLMSIRRSGLLIPLVGYGERDGFRYFQPLYWLIAPDKDATATLEYRSDRAWGGTVEYRMLFGTQGFLRARVQAIDDWAADRTFLASDLNADYTGQEGQRAFFRGSHVSEEDFYREFSRTFEERIARYVESAGELSGQISGTRVRLVTRFLQNLEGPSDTLPARASGEAHTFGFFGSGLPGGGNLSMRLSNGMEAWVRSEGTSVYSLRLAPRMELPFRSGLVSGGVFLDGYAEGFVTDGNESENGIALNGGAAVEVGTRLGRRYGSWNHVVEPRLRYDHRVRGGEFVEDLEMERALGSARLLTGRLVNRFFSGSRQVGFLEISGGIDPGRNDDEWEPLRVAGMIQQPVELALETRYSPNKRILEQWSSAIRITLPGGYAQLGHRYDKTDPDADSTTATVVELAHAITKSLHATGRVWYDMNGGGVREVLVKTSWVKDCWGLGVSFVRQLEETRVLASVFLRGLGYLGSADIFPPLP